MNFRELPEKSKQDREISEQAMYQLRESSRWMYEGKNVSNGLLNDALDALKVHRCLPGSVPVCLPNQEGLLFRGALPARLMHISARSGLTMEPMVDLPIWNEWVIPCTGKNTGKPFV